MWEVASCWRWLWCAGRFKRRGGAVWEAVGARGGLLSKRRGGAVWKSAAASCSERAGALPRRPAGSARGCGTRAAGHASALVEARAPHFFPIEKNNESLETVSFGFLDFFF